MTTVARVVLINSRQKIIRYCAHSHQINFEDNQINGDEDIALLRFFAAILEKSLSLEL